MLEDTTMKLVRVLCLALLLSHTTPVYAAALTGYNTVWASILSEKAERDMVHKLSVYPISTPSSANKNMS
jgi:hypothetical protein